MATGKETVVPPFLPSTNVMTNGYFGGVTMETANLNCVQVDQIEEVVSLRRSVDLGYITSTTIDNDDVKSKYKETEEVVRARPKYKDMSTQMKEYNVNYSGLVIIPWEEFAENPRKMNDLFYLENNGHITYDPDEVNVFFHATKMNKPTFGDISENGKAWVVNVETIRDVEQVRVWLLERISVFGVTLVRKTSRFGKTDRAPCLVMLDPTMGHSDSIHASIMRCINVMQDGKKFCLEIDLNGCVERWCRRITMTRCEAIGAKLVITNGEEPANLTDAENIFCCIVCFPIWSMQAGIYKLHRRALYKDFDLKFDAEELFLYGTLGGVRNQRAKLFRDYQKEVFRTKPIEEAGEEFQASSIDRHKYISVKKTLRRGRSKDEDSCYLEHETTDINVLLSKNNDDKFKEMINNQTKTVKSENTGVNQNSLMSSGEQGEKMKTGKGIVTSEQSGTLKTGNNYNKGDKQDIRIELRENTNSSDSSGFTRNSQDESKIKSFLEVESSTMRKELSPIQSARTVNSDIMIITQSNDEETPDGDGSEIDLKTFLNTELVPLPEKPKKKSKKHKRCSKPPKPPSKKNGMTEKQKNGFDNDAFENESENKFRRTLPSKRHSFGSIDDINTLASRDKNEAGSSATCRRDSIEAASDGPESIQNPLSDNEVMSLNPDTEEEEEEEAITLADDNLESNDNDENDNNSANQIFQINNKFQKHKNETKENHDESQDKNLILHDDMSCDDLELSDFDAEDDEKKQDDVVKMDTNQNISKRTNSAKKINNLRGTAPYRSNRQKYIGMNTSVKNGRLPSLKNN